MSRPSAILLGFAVPVAAFVSTGCQREGCLAGDDPACVVPSPCQKLSYSCDNGTAEARTVAAGDTLPGGINALGAVGDVLLQNDKISAVIEGLDRGLDNAHHLAPSGGNLIDLAVRGANNDGLNLVFTVTGILPGDAVKYTEGPRFLDAGPGVAAVQFRGALDGHPDVRVATRYEVRACEPGVRIRTELVNQEADPLLWALSDGFYWMGRSMAPFIPLPGEGFVHPGFDLLSINDAFRTFPFMAASTHTANEISASYGLVACNKPALEGFNSDRISGVGVPRRLVMPRDYEVYERFIGVARGSDIAPGASVAMEARSVLFGEKHVRLTGRVLRTGGTPVGGDENKATVIVSEDAADLGARVPWSQAVPGADGRFSALVPDGKTYHLDVRAFARSVASRTIQVSGDTDAGDLTVPLVGRVDLRVQLVGGGLTEGLVVALPADDKTREATTGNLLDVFQRCAPMLGPPNGPSPACNRVLVRGDNTSAEFPAGKYNLYATIGPFATIDRRQITVAPDGSPQAVTFRVQRLAGLQPAGTLSADLHVHSGASFDTDIPDFDRVLTFLASSIDVVGATDHDVVWDYARALAELGATARMVVMPGVETTGEILWMKVPGRSIPVVIGHWNMWPLRLDMSLPRHGVPSDELAEPGALFTRLEPFFSAKPMRQMNHPWSGADFGRDQGFPRALGLDLRKPLPDHDDGTSEGMLLRTPKDSTFSNADFQSLEVMNSTDNGGWLQHRALWFYLLDSGIPRAGTANSDSHVIAEGVLGTPRNVVYTTTTVVGFRPDDFNDSVRAGRVIGTNGPIVEATLQDLNGRAQSPGMTAFKPRSGALLHLKVSAAPWVAVDEVRVIVNAQVKKTLKAELSKPADPFGASGVLRYDGEFAVDSLLPADGRDAWLVIEAGYPVQPYGDLCPDGVPDTSDNTGDGVVDKADVEKGSDCGPLNGPPDPAEGDPRYHFNAVTPGGFPLGFTNPFLLDRDGDGKYTGPGVSGRGY